MQNVKILASLCSWVSWFEHDLITNTRQVSSWQGPYVCGEKMTSSWDFCTGEFGSSKGSDKAVTFYVSWSTSELRVRLAPLNRFKPSSKIFYWPFQGGTSFVDLLCFCSVLCLLCLCARLFICALWSHAGKGLTSWLSFVVLLWVCHFPIGILGQVWYLIVSIPDLCTLTYFAQPCQNLHCLQTRSRGIDEGWSKE